MATQDHSTRNDFYVYALFRENGVPFYIGKGRRDRWAAHTIEARLGRRGHRFNIIRDLLARGIDMPRVKLHEGLTEAVAHEYEIILIKAIGRGRGKLLVNQTDGGDGSSGCFPSPETRAKLSKAHRGKKRKPESIEKVAAAHRGRKRPPETCAKISARALLRAPALRAAMIARNANRSAADIAKSVAAMRGSQTPESIEKTAAKNRGKKRSPETRARQSAAAIGRKQTQEHIRNRVEARLVADARRRAEVLLLKA